MVFKKVKQLKLLSAKVVVAAGNHRGDSCDYSPASEPSIYTVGSIDLNDYPSRFTNLGKCIDFFTVGNDIRAANTQGGFKFGSGTSYSTAFATATITRCNSGNNKRSKKCIDRYSIRHVVLDLDPGMKNIFLKLI